MFARSIQGGCRDADKVTHNLALATQATVRRWTLQMQFFPARHWREIFGSFDDFHYARATGTVPLAVNLFINSLVNGNIMEQRRLAEVCVLSAIHLLARI